MRIALTVSSASTGADRKLKLIAGGLLRIGRRDVDRALALGPHRMGVAGDARLARDVRPLRTGLGEHRHPAEQQVGRLEPCARAHEGAHRRPHAGEQAAARDGIVQRLAHQPQPARGVVVGVALGTDQPAGARRVMVAQVLADAGQRAAHLDAERLQPLGLADARQLEQLRAVDRAGADHDIARRRRLVHRAVHRIAHAGAARAVEDQALGQRLGHDAEVGPLGGRIEIAARRAHALAGDDRRLAHDDAVLRGAVVVGIVRDADFGGGLDQRLEDRLARRRIGDPDRPVTAAEPVVAATLVALHALEEGQHVGVAPAGDCPSAPRCRSPAPGRARRPCR